MKGRALIQRAAQILISLSWICSAASAGLFYSDTQTIRAGNSAAIPIRAEVLRALESIEWTISDTNRLALLRSAEAPSPPYETAFLHVRADAPGDVTLSTGEESLRVIIEPDEEGPLDELRIPRIVTPVMDSYVWGDFSVAVECLADGWTEDAFRSAIRVRCSDGRELAPVEMSDPDEGPVRTVRFTVDLEGVPEGPIRVTPVLASLSDGPERIGDALTLHVLQPDSIRVRSAECEAHLEIDRDLRYRRADRTPKVASHAEASGGKYVVNASPRPSWVLPLEIEEDGRYQFMMRLRGQAGANSFPTVGLYLNEKNRVETSCRVAGEAWHRLPLGAPVDLTAGTNYLTVYFENDFYVKSRADRNLELDRMEWVRLDETSGTAGGGPGMGMMSMMGGSMGASSDELRVEFLRLPPGHHVTGAVTLRGQVRWNAVEAPVAPEVSLIVNGQRIDAQYAVRPEFTIPRSAFKAGTNTVRLLARSADGAYSVTPSLNLFASAAAGSGWRPPHRHSFDVFHPGWDERMKNLIRRGQREKRQPEAGFFSFKTSALELDASMQGAFELSLRARGDWFEGAPQAQIKLVTSTGPTNLPPVKVGKRMGGHSLGRISLPPGPKHLELSFINDHYEPEVGDRNLFVESIRFTEVETPEDRELPRVELTHPRENQSWDTADAVVAVVDDDRGIQWGELILDGEATGLRMRSIDGLGRLVFPVHVEDIEPGAHRVQVRVRDRSGQMTTSDSVTVQVRSGETEPTEYQRAVHLLHRLGFGPQPELLADVLAMGTEAWIGHQLSEESHQKFLDVSLSLMRFPDPNNGNQAVVRSLDHLLQSDQVVLARHQMWLENHFSTWLRKTRGRSKWEERQALARYSASGFRDLLYASATSPAMLVYLDQQKSFGGRINENYAREVMELHTLGVDNGYGQEDVTELARILTGWMTVQETGMMGEDKRNRHSFKYAPALGDTEAKQFLGHPFAEPRDQGFYGVVRALDMLAAHPNTATTLARKFANHFLSEPAGDALVEDLAMQFRGNGGNFRELLLALTQTPAFWEGMKTPRLSTPMDYGVRLARFSGDANIWHLRNFLNTAGMGLYDREFPDGYPDEGEAYADSNAFLQRFRFAEQKANGLDRQFPIFAGTAWNRLPDSADRWIDAFAIFLNGTPLPPVEREAIVQFAASIEEDYQRPRRDVIALLCQLPATQFR